MMSVKIYTLLRQYGTALFEEYIDYTYDLAQSFAGMLKQESDLELACNPKPTWFAFVITRQAEQHKLKQTKQPDSQKLIEDGEFYIVQTQLKDDIWLRVTLMNPLPQLWNCGHYWRKSNSSAGSSCQSNSGSATG